MTNQPPITEVLFAQSSPSDGVNSRTEHFSLRLSQSELQHGIDQGVQTCASVISMGNEVAEILRKGRVGRVLAVFARSFYVQRDQDVFCIGVASLGRGPLHVLIASDNDILPLPVNCGMSVCLNSNCFLAADTNAALYSGRVSGKALNSLALQCTRDALKFAVPPSQYGFGWILGSLDWQCQIESTESSKAGLAAIDSSLRNQCLPVMQCLKHWLESSIAQPVKPSDGGIPNETISQAPALLGAGPGLTPSGDDLLAGVMLALHRNQRADLANSLWQKLEPHLARRTNAISGAHLRMAAFGQSSEPVLFLLECVFDDSDCHQSDDVRAIATDIQALASRIGASSGWDTLAGMSLVLHAL